MSKIKIFNDPVHGFVRIPRDILFHLIEHKYFQRLGRIKQLGLTHMVYPGALHTRFHHALGALHFMQEAIDNLRSKDKEITEKEAEAASIAILLHDIGHAPFSHSLEFKICGDISHETLSLLFMERLNEQFDGKLTLAMEIFRGTYHKKFLHHLVSSQLDLDRLDYLRRDSFYTGVSEGVIGSDRIIKMLNVRNDELVVEAKGIHSIENFLIARRMMYWQVYLHKTVLGAEQLLIKIIERARFLIEHEKQQLFTTPALKFFLSHNVREADFYDNSKVLDTFAELDDYDIITGIKVWANHNDKVLAFLSRSLIERKLFKITFAERPFSTEKIKSVQDYIVRKIGISEEDAGYFVFTGTIENQIYNPEEQEIKILYNNGDVIDIAKASSQYDFSVKGRHFKKSFLCYPKLADELLIN